MKFFATLPLAMAACAVAMPSQHRNLRRQAPQLGDTLVLFEVGGVPGNECLTFRNNGMRKFVLSVGPSNTDLLR